MPWVPVATGAGDRLAVDVALVPSANLGSSSGSPSWNGRVPDRRTGRPRSVVGKIDGMPAVRGDHHPVEVAATRAGLCDAPTARTGTPSWSAVVTASTRCASEAASMMRTGEAVCRPDQFVHVAMTEP